MTRVQFLSVIIQWMLLLCPRFFGGFTGPAATSRWLSFGFLGSVAFLGCRGSDIAHHHNVAAGYLFNIAAATFLLPPPKRITPPLFIFTGLWSLLPTEPAAYNLAGFPPIPPQLILWEGIVMQIKDA